MHGQRERAGKSSEPYMSRLPKRRPVLEAAGLSFGAAGTEAPRPAGKINFSGRMRRGAEKKADGPPFYGKASQKLGNFPVSNFTLRGKDDRIYYW